VFFASLPDGDLNNIGEHVAAAFSKRLGFLVAIVNYFFAG
jgi:hypothetical protein